MRETDNIFDTSTTLMEIEEPAGGDAGPRPDERSAADAGSEPDYFTPNPAIGHTDARRRALAVLALVGGGILTAVLISAATGSGESRTASRSKSATQREQPVGGRAATVVAPERAPESGAVTGTRTHASRTGRGNPRGHGGAGGNGGARGGHTPGASAHRQHHHSPKAQSKDPAPPPEPSYSPEPETTYSPEPETTYVPTEEAAPPPTPSASSPPSGAQQEFGIEP
jgi:hypothetical protein